MVLTTNYDDCFSTAFRQQHGREMAICGRNADDAQYVLNALYEPADPILWALQGYLGGPFGEAGNELAAEIVVGHEEYRKVAHAEPHFRRAFAEVFRSRSMLFLGSGLQEPYFREMFSEIFEIYGPCARAHYAFVKRGDLDVQFLATRFQVIVVEYDDHAVVEDWLNRLADAVEGPVFRQDRFSFAFRPVSTDDAFAPYSRLTVVNGPVRGPSTADECLAVSAGGAGGRFFFGQAIAKLLQDLGCADTKINIQPSSTFVGRFQDFPIYAVRAREKGDSRSLRVVRHASADLFDVAWQEGFRRIGMQVLAAGGSEKSLKPYDVTPFSAMYSFLETVRAFGRWCTAHPEIPLELAIHVVDPLIYFEISRGRLDIDELLSSVDLRFWAKLVYPDGRIQRQLCQELENERLAGIACWLGLDPGLWSVESIPHIGASGEPRKRPVSTIAEEPLSSLVIPGGTLRFTTLGQS
jgi:hypothetical protein